LSNYIVKTLTIVLGCSLLTTACEKRPPATPTIVLSGTYNMNNKCVGHASGLCGTEDNMLPTEIAGVFATEPGCEGVHLRGLTDKERSTPIKDIPLHLDIFYEGTRTEPYMGTGKGETDGWMFSFNGPRGHFSGKARTEQEIATRVCRAAKGLGAEIDSSVGYSH
jgi:hypothetical protein